MYEASQEIRFIDVSKKINNYTAMFVGISQT